MKKFAVLAVSAVLVLAGCNTVSGMGKDVKAGGQAVTNAAENTKASM